MTGGNRLRPEPIALAPRPPAGAADLAARFGTPLYVMDGARLAAEAQAFAAAWGPDVTVAYSMKANPLLGITARLHRAGCWAEVASGFEYRSARRAGVPGHQIVFNGPLKRSGENAQSQFRLTLTSLWIGDWRSRALSLRLACLLRRRLEDGKPSGVPWPQCFWLSFRSHCCH